MWFKTIEVFLEQVLLKLIQLAIWFAQMGLIPTNKGILTTFWANGDPVSYWGLENWPLTICSRQS